MSNTDFVAVNDFLANFLVLLTQKEKYVIERRFNLDNTNKATLEEIGQHYGVTRERVRQIEKNALGKLKRNLANFDLKEIADIAYEMLKEKGGIVREDSVVSRVVAEKPIFSRESIQLILAVDSRFERIQNTVHFFPHIRVVEINDNFLGNITSEVLKVLDAKGKTMGLEEIFAHVSKKNLNVQLSLNLVKSILEVDKRIKILTEKSIGLIEWRDINPRTLRDKIFFVLREKKLPMHFVDIANEIVNLNFDKKKVNLQAVHNELIRFEDFVLVGRGIYGLKEWGYLSGTVADIIEALLKEKKVMSQEEILQEVLKQRHVKPITILLSLKNKKQFVRVGRKQYSLVKS